MSVAPGATCGRESWGRGNRYSRLQTASGSRRSDLRARVLGCIGQSKAATMSERTSQQGEDRVEPARALRRDRCGKTPEPRIGRSVRGTGRAKVVVIGASTGGPNALREVLSGLPADFPLPILIAQHMPPTFTPMLAARLERESGRPCSEGRAGESIEPNRMYVAPGDSHMTIGATAGRYVVRLNQEPEEHYCRPSVNPLFRTAASHYGKSVLAVMLTGMGTDGIEATHDIVEHGGYVMAQDEASSVVWGMPGAVVRERLAHEVLPLEDIADAIMARCSTQASRV